MAMDMVPVRLQPQATAMLDDLIAVGLYGGTRAEVARSLILDQLKRLAAEGLVSIKRQD